MRKITGLFLLLLTSIPSIGIAREKKSQKNEISHKAVEERKRKITREIMSIFIEKYFSDFVEEMKKTGLEKELRIFLERAIGIMAKENTEERLQQYLMAFKDEDVINNLSPEIIEKVRRGLNNGMRDEKALQSMGKLIAAIEKLIIPGMYIAALFATVRFASSMKRTF